jgi:hypothetical protein
VKIAESDLNPRKKYASPPTRRTLERILLYAHRACGQCPGCLMEIVPTQADVKDPSKQMAMAQVGDAEPAKGSWSDRLVALEET